MSEIAKPRCDYTGHDFGATYPDACCIDGYLWDMDSCEEAGSPILTHGGNIPCPKCNAAARDEYEDGHVPRVG